MLRAPFVLLTALWVEMKIRREAEFPIFRRDSRPYWRSDRYWRDTRFYLDADLTVAIGMLRVYQQVAARQIRLSSLTRLQLRSTQRERIFTFQHGVWTCTGQCCQQLPLTWDAFTHHAHNVIALPRSAPLPAILGTGFVRSIRYVGPNPLPSYAPTLSIGPAGDRLRVAELNWDVAVNDTVAFQASAGSWDGLMFRELTGIWAWYES